MGLLKSPSGAIVSVPDDQVESARANGYEPVSDAEAGSSIAAPESEDRGVLGGINAAATGTLSGLTLGLSDIGLSHILNRGQRERLAQEREGHPWASGISEIGGSLLPGVLSGGATAAEGLGAKILSHSPAGLVSDVGRAITGVGAESSVLGRTLAGTAGAAAEGSLYGGGQYLAQTALEDKPLSAEGFVGAMGHGALFAAPVGGALTLGEAALVRARSLFPRQQMTREAAREVSRSATSELAGAVADGDRMATLAKQQIDLSEAKFGMAESGERVTRRMFGDADQQSLIDQVGHGADKQQIVDALQRYNVSKAQLSDWLRNEADPDLEAALLGVHAPDVGEAGGRIEKQPGKTWQPDLADGTPLPASDLNAALDARSRQVDATKIGKRPANDSGVPSDLLSGVGQPTTKFDLADSGLSFDSETRNYFASGAAPNGSLEDLLQSTKKRIDGGESLGTIAGVKHSAVAAQAPAAGGLEGLLQATQDQLASGKSLRDISAESPARKAYVTSKELEVGKPITQQGEAGRFEVKRVGRPTEKRFEVVAPDGTVRPMSRDEATTWAESQMPPGFSTEGIETHRDFSVEHDMPSIENHGGPRSESVENSIFVVRPSQLAGRELYGNEINPEHLASVSKAADEGKRLPPIRIDIDNGRYYVEDGNHRLLRAAADDSPVAVRFRVIEPFSGWRPQAGSERINNRIVDEFLTRSPQDPHALAKQIDAAADRAYDAYNAARESVEDGMNAADAQGLLRQGDREFSDVNALNARLQRIFDSSPGKYAEEARLSNDALGKSHALASFSKVQRGFIESDSAFKGRARDVEALSAGEYNKFARSYNASLPRQQQNALRDYTKFIDGEVNSALRKSGGGLPPEVLAARGSTGRPLEESLTGLDEAIAASSAPRDMKVYRVAVDRDGKAFGHLKAGDPFVDDGYLSATAREAFTDRLFETHLAKGDPAGRVDFQISVPKGSKAAPINEASKFQGEKEILFPRGSKFQVESVDVGEGGRRTVRMRLVQASEPAASGDLESLLRGTKAQIDAGASISDVASGRAPSAAPVAPRAPGSLSDLDALVSGWKPQTTAMLGKRIMAHAGEGLPASSSEYSARAALGKRIGKNVDMGESLSRAARAIGDFESASADLAEKLGDAAPKTAVHRAVGYRSATAAHADEAATSAAQAARDINDKIAPIYATGGATTVDDAATEALRAHDSRTVAPPRAADRTMVDDADVRSMRAFDSGAANRTVVDDAGVKALRQADSKAAPNAAAEPEPGMLGKAANVGSALEVLKALGVHIPAVSAIPVIGPVLGLFLKARAAMAILGRKGGAIPRSTESVIAAKAAATRDRIAAATHKLLESGIKVSRAATPATAAVLSQKLFPGGPETGGKDPQELYRARMDEIARAQQPGALGAALADRFHTSDPALQDALVNQVARGLAFLDSKAPKQTVLPGMLPGDGTWKPSKAALDEWARYVRAVNDPASVLEDLTHGKVTLEGAETLRVVYPRLFAEAQQLLLARAVDMQKTLPYPTRVAISIMYRIPVDATMTPQHMQFLQSPTPTGNSVQGTPSPSSGMSAITAPLKTQTLTALDRRAGA